MGTINIGWYYFRVENKGDSFFKKEFGLYLMVFQNFKLNKIKTRPKTRELSVILEKF